MTPVWVSSQKRVNLEAPHQDLKSICQELLPQWQHLEHHQIELAVVSGGITNCLFKASAPSVDPVLLRIYGAYTEKFIDREMELNLMKTLFPLKFGAQVLGTFVNGRVEAFLDSRPLESSELRHPIAAAKIAGRLAEFHAVPVPLPRSIAMFDTLREWIDIATELQFTDDAHQKLLRELDLAALKRDLPALQDAAEAFQSPIVFCHNDLLSGNILLLREPGKELTLEQSPLTFVDFEYSTYGYRGFDLGNHFNEYAGFDGDFELCYPTVEEQRIFFKSYLHHSAGGSNMTDHPTVESLMQEAAAFAALSHLYWGTWGILQARYSTVDFDFLSYSATRLKHFRKGRRLILKEV